MFFFWFIRAWYREHGKVEAPGLVGPLRRFLLLLRRRPASGPKTRRARVLGTFPSSDSEQVHRLRARGFCFSPVHRCVRTHARARHGTRTRHPVAITVLAVCCCWPPDLETWPPLRSYEPRCMAQHACVPNNNNDDDDDGPSQQHPSRSFRARTPPASFWVLLSLVCVEDEPGR